MAADPEVTKGIGAIARTFLPYAVIIVILTGLDKALVTPRRKSYKRSKSHDTELPAILLGLLAVGFLFYTTNRGAFWIYAILLICGFIIYLLIKRQLSNKYFLEQDNLSKLRSLNPTEFEGYIAKLFSRLGFITEKVGGSYDGGIDVIATKKGVKYFIQCKKFITSQVSVGAVRDFYGAVADQLKNAKALFVSTNVFTLEAEKFCEGKPIELIDGKKLMEYIRQAGVEVPETQEENLCPKCSGVLKHRNGKYGSFIGCSNYPKCTYTKST